MGETALALLAPAQGLGPQCSATHRCGAQAGVDGCRLAAGRDFASESLNIWPSLCAPTWSWAGGRTPHPASRRGSAWCRAR